MKSPRFGITPSEKNSPKKKRTFFSLTKGGQKVNQMKIMYSIQPHTFVFWCQKHISPIKSTELTS